ncbi:ATP-binding response regulator [Paraburkholderia phenoliruptrix]|uniref:ATP-binding response regulator n=1 Tax=Paraburkholderia phenoliruptrix TaxID=252970 RepID=UPI0001C031A1|nr:response regulator [Paraburkholderia phenoliruptrix]MDR6391526.1 CheY-like chemotaxis protein [Paraburkholderia phenoliruptrix]WMY11656.1 response regulator [Paraburkholderia phenoliruptrix]
MKAISGGIRYLNRVVSEAAKVSDYSVLAVGLIGTLGHPVYWFWWTFVDPQPNENPLMRVVGTASCALLLLRRFWPAPVARLLPWYYFATVAYTLPFFFTYYLLAGDYSMLWSMAELGMVFFLIAIFPSFVALSLNLALGIGAAVLCARIVIPQALHVDAHLFVYTYLPVFTFGICAGITFSYSNLKGIVAQARTGALRALAGSIAHEMRNPLSQLKHVLDRVEEVLPAAMDHHASPAASQRRTALLYRHLAHGQLSIERGLRIIAMTLDEVSAKAIRSDQFTYVSAAAATRKALEEYGFGDQNERARVRLAVLEDFTFKVDETVYLFTLFNLIKNALHHIAAHPSATLTLTVDRHTVIVHDTGPGIAPEMLPHLFEPFRTAGNSAGTGLGLAYCQRAMRAFGGSIRCRSEVGQFTQFTLEFPPVSEAEVARHEQEVFEHAAPFLQGKRILVVDNDADQRKRVQRALSKAGALPREAADGEAALAALGERQAWDVVLMDINMPGLDGYTATERIRADRRNPNCDVIVVAYTAEPGNVARVLARRAGMDEFVSKSASMVELIGVLRKLFENGHQHGRSQRFDGFAGKTILLADDDTYSRLVAKGYLERFGATVVEAEHGPAVLARLQEGAAIDAIVIDMNMPGMGGVETTSLIRARSDAYASVPIIALTSQTDMEAVERCLAAGMNEVMTKPAQIGALYAALARQFARHRAQHLSADAASSHEGALPAGKSMPLGEGPLLDEKHLQELVALDLLDQTFLNGIEQIRSTVATLATSVAARDLDSTREALHVLLGVSGNIGARALHQFLRQIYPRVVEGEWPAEADWLARICSLSDRSAPALQTYFASAKAPEHHRKTTSD